MKGGKKQFENKIVNQINDLADTMSRVTGDLEARINEIENEQSIVKNHYSNLESRLNYLEKKILK